MNHPVGVHWLLVGFFLGGLGTVLLSQLRDTHFLSQPLLVALVGILFSPLAFVAIMRVINAVQKSERQPRSKTH